MGGIWPDNLVSKYCQTTSFPDCLFNRRNRIWRQIWRVAGRESDSPELLGSFPDFPGTSPNFPGSFSATSPEVLSLWNLPAIQGFPGSFPDFPGTSPDFPEVSWTSPEVSPFTGKPDTLSWLAKSSSEELRAFRRDFATPNSSKKEKPPWGICQRRQESSKNMWKSFC